MPPETYAAMLKAYEGWSEAKVKPGRPPALALAEQLVLALEFWREYRSHYHLAQPWKVDESTVRCTIERVENALVKSGAFALPGRRAAAGARVEWQMVVVDVAEWRWSGLKKQRKCYSSKKKRHTLKTQVADRHSLTTCSPTGAACP